MKKSDNWVRFITHVYRKEGIHTCLTHHPWARFSEGIDSLACFSRCFLPAAHCSLWEREPMLLNKCPPGQPFLLFSPNLQQTGVIT